MSDLAAPLREGDPDRFWATLAAPMAVRDRLWPIYAVNLEVARAPWASDQPLLAEMRLQWWIDALRGDVPTGGDRPAVLQALDRLGVPGALQALAQSAEARRGDCWATEFAYSQDLNDFLDGTAGSVMWAAALALGAGPDDQQAVRAHGRVQGLAAYLLARPRLMARGRDRMARLSDPAVRDLAQRLLADQRAARLKRALHPALFTAALATPVVQRMAARAGAAAVVQPLSEFRRRAILARLALWGRV